jgi:hypothetical protein
VALSPLVVHSLLKDIEDKVDAVTKLQSEFEAGVEARYHFSEFSVSKALLPDT